MDPALIMEAQAALSVGLEFVQQELARLQGPDSKLQGLQLEDRLNHQVDRRRKQETLEANRRDFQAALERIERGQFGICSDCGEEIPAARLRANVATFGPDLYAGYHVKRCCPCQERRTPVWGTPWHRSRLPRLVRSTAAGLVSN